LATVGPLENRPNSRNVVPGSVFFTIHLRHPSADVVVAMEAEMKQRLECIAADAQVETSMPCEKGLSHNEAEHAEENRRRRRRQCAVARGAGD
jgi:hypothetical protein